MRTAGLLLALVVAVLGITTGPALTSTPAEAALLRQPPQPYEGYAELPGVHLWYTDTGGSGVPIVLLHAATGNTEMWQNNTASFADAGYRAIAFDRRGWGRSEANPATGPQPGSASDDLQALADYLGLDTFHLLGIAAGGSVAYDYALSHPERLRSLIVAASGAGGLQDRELAETRERSGLPDFREWPVQFRELSQGYMAANPRGVDQWLELVSHSQQESAPSQPTRNPLTVQALQSIALPTLLLAGDADLSNPPWVIRRQADLIPGAQLVVVGDSGHSINWEQPAVFAREVIGFISAH